ncbi:ferric reductase-like transmembrane domain-containing protein [Microbacterium foliorum]|uniref:ferredoxin reductase family protein n=1 Tax=Microbacterium foliorum TaxID=104336 RepID=UPI0009A04C14|nr:ferric reductase-like transmembrane domain-containing protein [Microbacterium foliorum]AQY00332.1 oxidoreductase [Microbacterium foliorum]
MTTLTTRPRASVPAASPEPRRAAHGRARVWRAAAITVIWATSLFVVALWIACGGVTAVLGVNAETVTTLGRLTGLVAANLLLYQVLLMARVPLFERGFGRDGITRLHRFVGFWSFWLMGAHIALLAVGYAMAAGINPLVQLWSFIWEYPGMLLATAGTLLILLVVVTSIRRARRHLRYESWHLLHLYAYLGVGLALPHQLWTGADFLSSPIATVYWWSIWALSAGSVLLFRIGMPLLRSTRRALRVAGVEADGARGVTIRVTGRDLATLGARAGQFFFWRFLDGPGWTRAHPFSLSAAPGSELTLTARVLGDGTRRLTALLPGTRVIVEGPYGEMTGERRTGTKLLMIGAGAGVAPLVSLLETEGYGPGEAMLITRESAAEDALRQEAIAHLISTRGLSYLPFIGPRSSGASSWIPATHEAWSGADLLRHLVPEPKDHDVFICGGEAWMKDLRRDLVGAGFPAHRIHSESFTI